jgi:hypothetical protein
MSLNSASLTTTVANIYASSGNSVMSVAYLCNYSASPVTVNVFAVISGGTASSSNIIYSNVVITAGDTLVIDKEKIVFGNGETLKANASANSAVTSTVSYTGV